MKDVAVSESYLNLDKLVKGCQNEEPLHNCTTRKYKDAFLKNCGCVPFNIRLTEQVCLEYLINYIYTKLLLCKYAICKQL